MTFSLPLSGWCILAAAVLPFACAYIAKAGAYGPRDNDSPREWALKQSGWRARANAAQANSFEGLAFFIGAVLLAQQLGADQGAVDRLALAYVLLRVVYIGLYIKGLGMLRSAVWSLGFLANVALLFAGR